MRTVVPMNSTETHFETERLTFRPIALQDSDLLIQLLSDVEVMKFVGDVMTPNDVRARAKDFIKRGAGGRIGIWCVTAKENGEKLGTGELLPLPIDRDITDWELFREESYPNAEIEVGYLLKPSAWGKGFATEICSRMLQFVFEATELAEIVAVTDPENLASQRVLTKCGLRHEGTRYAYKTDVTSFRLSRDQWENRLAVPGKTWRE